LWEFTDPDLGYTYGQPTILKTRAYGWVVVIGSGYNNSDGKGYIFILNARTGERILKLDTGAGEPTAPAGLAHVQGFVLDLTDGTADSLYAGDLLGNVWRVDVTATDGNYPAPLHLAQLKDSNDKALPITSRVTPMVQPGTNRRFVTVGTGRLLHANDISSSQGQTLFAIIDGTAARFGQATTLPPGISYPIVRSKLKQLSDLQTGIVLNLSTQIGWYIDLGAIGAGPGWRVIDDPIAFYGIVAFTSIAPTSSDVCKPGGNSRVYAIDLGTGVSALPSKQAYLDFAGLVPNIDWYSYKGNPYVVPTVCDADGCKSQPVKINPASGLGVRRLNWREIPQTN
uniref:pilus assembly protein n=1 Tax=Roseateles sp. TaxID=1971397 RepID=UPI00286BFEF0